MTRSPQIDAIALCLQAGHTPLIEGPPGGGKTMMLNALFRGMDRPLKTLIAALHEPSDFNGWPHAENGVMRFLPIDWVTFCLENPNAGIFFDELKAAPPAVQNALLRVIHERWVGSIQLPDTISFIAACNSAEQTAGGWELGDALANRMIHMSWKPSTKEWIDGMSAGWPVPEVPILPKNWRDSIPEVKALVLGYLSRRQSKLFVDPSPGQMAFPSGRTWDKIIELLGACLSVGLKLDSEPAALLANGSIGVGEATEFLTWARRQDLPDPEEVLKNPTGYDYGSMDGDKLFATLHMVMDAVVTNNTPARWLAGWKVAGAAGKAKLDIATQAARSLAKNKPPGPPLPAPTEAFIFGNILALAGKIS